MFHGNIFDKFQDLDMASVSYIISFWQSIMLDHNMTPFLVSVAKSVMHGICLAVFHIKASNTGSLQVRPNNMQHATCRNLDCFVIYMLQTLIEGWYQNIYLCHIIIHLSYIFNFAFGEKCLYIFNGWIGEFDINAKRPKKNGLYFVDNLFNCFLVWNNVLWLKFNFSIGIVFNKSGLV